MYLEQILIGILAAINIFAFFIMLNDKQKSIRGDNTDRTPEGFLFFLAAAFGSAGIYLGMLTFRHKTKKWYFQLGIPLLILQNLAALYITQQFLIIN
ncbi:MAG: hypothetical protein RL538_284 [Candidatus Parcubacteria bacterium]|jgi:uncharacterized membrane protein YsdA (DUF1294 family)